MFKPITKLASIGVSIAIVVCSTTILLVISPLTLIKTTIRKPISPRTIKSTIAPASLIILVFDFATYKPIFYPLPLSYYFPIAIEDSLSISLAMSPFSLVSVTVRIDLLSTSLFHVHLPLPIIKITIQVVHFALACLFSVI